MSISSDHALPSDETTPDPAGPEAGRAPATDKTAADLVAGAMVPGLTATMGEEPTPPGPAPNPKRQLATFIAAVVGLPLVLYLVLQPENYGLTPNGLDPLFYTGYAINFDDIIATIGDNHYFVSRWSSYYPSYVATLIFGPFLGRLVLRWLLAVFVLGVIWSLGQKQWSWAQRILIGTLVVTMPMFVRAFFTDYVEFMVVALGLGVATLALSERQTVTTAGALGALSGLCIVANPLTVTMVGFPLAAAVLTGARGLRRRLAMAAVIVTTALMAVAGGWALFRWGYGIDNVYQPTIDLTRAGLPPDALRSSRLEWLGRFTWLYATPVLLVTAAGLAWRRTVRFRRIDVIAFVVAGLQYLYQWADQFLRAGNGLEISYYWVFSYPSFAVSLALLVGRLTTKVAPIKLAAATGAWLLLLSVGVPNALRLPPAIGFVALAVAVVAAVILATRRYPMAAAALLVGFIGWTQIGAPNYDPSSYFFFNASPRYEDLYRPSDPESESVYREIVWFEQQMDALADDRDATFLPTGGWANAISGVYGSHVTGQLASTTDSNTGVALSPETRASIQLGRRPLLVVYGPPDTVAVTIDAFPDDLDIGAKLLDVTHRSALGYRLTAFEMPSWRSPPFTWSADVLPRLFGEVEGNRVEATGSDDGAAGFLTYGPYITLDPGHYEVVIGYSASADSSRRDGGANVGAGANDVGQFDISNVTDGVISAVALPSTDGATEQATISFEVKNGDDLPPWEFRTWFGGKGTLTVESITLLAADD